MFSYFLADEYITTLSIPKNWPTLIKSVYFRIQENSQKQ